MHLRTARLVVLASFVAKIALLAARYPGRPQSFSYIDSRSYTGPALALLSKGTFSPSPEKAPEPEINRTPGYPALVAALYRAFGERPWVLSAAGAVLSAGTALVLISLARRLFDERAALFSAVLLSLDFGSFWRSLDVLSDTPFTFLAVAGALLAAVSVERSGAPAARTAFLAGLALASATRVRPISLYLLPLIVLLLALGRPRRAALVRAGAFLAPCLVLVGGWAARNLARAGEFTVTPLPSSQALFFFASGVQAEVDGITIPEEQERLGNWERHYRSGGASEAEVFGNKRYEDLFPDTARLPYVELCRRWREKALDIVRAHPLLTAKKLAIYVGVLLLTPPTLIFGFQYGLYWPEPSLSRLFDDLDFVALFARLASTHPVVFAVSIACVAELAALLLLALKGLAAARPWDARHALVAATLAYMVLASAGTQACDDRFRLPITPFLALYAGFALSGLLPRREAAR